MNISAKDLIRVLKACKDAQVSELKIGEVEVKFGPGEAAKQQAVKRIETPAVTEGELKESQNLANVGDNLRDAEERMALLQIGDPAQYEQLLLEGELEDSAQITQH